jgi:hypothetical protein
MRADIHDGSEHNTRSNQKPDTLMQDRIARIDETSCTARPDHTFGSRVHISPKEDCDPYRRIGPKADADSTLRHISGNSRGLPMTRPMHRSKGHAYSMTSSASDSKLWEGFRPNALAVFRLIAISNLVGCNTGISAGFAPLRTLPA